MILDLIMWNSIKWMLNSTTYDHKSISGLLNQMLPTLHLIVQRMRAAHTWMVATSTATLKAPHCMREDRTEVISEAFKLFQIPEFIEDSSRRKFSVWVFFLGVEQRLQKTKCAHECQPCSYYSTVRHFHLILLIL